MQLYYFVYLYLGFKKYNYILLSSSKDFFWSILYKLPFEVMSGLEVVGNSIINGLSIESF